MWKISSSLSTALPGPFLYHRTDLLHSSPPRSSLWRVWSCPHIIGVSPRTAASSLSWIWIWIELNWISHLWAWLVREILTSSTRLSARAPRKVRLGGEVLQLDPHGAQQLVPASSWVRLAGLVLASCKISNVTTPLVEPSASWNNLGSSRTSFIWQVGNLNNCHKFQNNCTMWITLSLCPEAASPDRTDNQNNREV